VCGGAAYQYKSGVQSENQNIATKFGEEFDLDQSAARFWGLDARLEGQIVMNRKYAGDLLRDALPN
jgi:hypothetical protein